MSFFPMPDYKFKEILQVTPQFLKEEGIGCLLLDLDNTISPYGTSGPTERVLEWVQNMKDGGITLFIVSNSRSSRPAIFANAMGIEYIDRAKKPLTDGVERAIVRTGATKEGTALAGDQIFTDVLASKRAGIRSILVEPIKLSNPFFVARYIMELPFRRERKRRDD